MGRWVDGEMGRFGHCIGLTHTQRYHARYHTAGEGPVYQGRLKSFPVQDDEHFLRVARYVERNAYSAGLCERPEAWQWGSLHHWSHWSHWSPWVSRCTQTVVRLAGATPPELDRAGRHCF